MTRSYQATNARRVHKRCAIRPSTTSSTTHKAQTRPSRRTILGYPRARRGRLIRKPSPPAPTPSRTTNEVTRGILRSSGLYTVLGHAFLTPLLALPLDLRH